MADARELTYGISFNSEDAVNDVEQLEQGLGRIDDATDRAQIGAQNCSQAMSSMGAAGTSAARDVGSAAQNMGERFEEAGDDIGDKFRKMGAQADSFGAAFKKTMAAGIKDGQSLAKSFQTGVSGAISFTQKKFTGFKNDVSKGAKAIGNAFKHPIQTIKDKLSKAIIHAADSTDALEDGADDAEKALDDMGNTGSEAGNKVKEAISGALKAFLGIEAIKAAASAIKEFATAALDAAKAGENTAAKFDTLFEGTNAAAWADNYADAVHRSTTEVKGFLVENQAMYTDLGLTKDAATDLSKITTSLAYDFGNAFKMEDADALAVIQEGIKGNSSALTEYGIKLDDATIKAQAQAMGLGENIDEMDEATLAQVRLASMIEQTSKVQQAAINDTDGLTNSTKSLKGIWANFMEDAGNKFAPVLSDFYGVIIGGQQAQSTLQNMRERRDIVSYTGRNRVSNLVITSLTFDASAKNAKGCSFKATFQQVNISSAEVVEVGAYPTMTQQDSGKSSSNPTQTKKTSSDGLKTTVSSTISSSAYAQYVSSYDSKPASSSGPASRTTPSYNGTARAVAVAK